MSNIELYNLLRVKLGEAEAKSPVDFVESSVDNGFNQRRETFATKQDVKDLEVKMAQMEARIIKWMFIFWVGQIATVIAIMKLL